MSDKTGQSESGRGAGEKENKSQIGLLAASSIGVGGMIGAGIFSVLGIAAQVAGGAAFVSFAIAGIVALLCAYSFAHLGATFPSAGGPVEFLVKGFGRGGLSGTLNLMLWIGYVFALALYARAFGAYATSLIPDHPPAYVQPLIAAGVVVLFTALNFLGGVVVGRAELAIVIVKVVILLLFTISGLFFIEPSRLAVGNWAGPRSIIFAAGIIFLAYEGFGLVTNAADDMSQPDRTLPRALYLSVLLTILVYVSVTLAVVGNLPVAEIIEARDHALAAAAQPFLGRAGFTIIAVAALFSTASAINATLYGGANVSYMLARKGGLPAVFRRRLWEDSRGGLVITAGLVICCAVLFDLEGIALMGSMTFLVVYGAVSVAHLRLIGRTGAKKSVVLLALLGCFASFASLVFYQAARGWVTLAVFGGLTVLSVAFEFTYHTVRRRS